MRQCDRDRVRDVVLAHRGIELEGNIGADCPRGRRAGQVGEIRRHALVEAYQAANVKMDVTDMRAAVERQNDDGSFDVLVAFRFRAPSNPDTQNQEIGLRLRALMKPEDGRFKIAKLDPVMT